MIYMGIDPGKSGGIASIENGVAIAHKMPATEQDIYEQLKIISVSSTGCFCVIEKVHSSPQMGVTSAFTFGRGYGGLLMALSAIGIPFVECTPNKWQMRLSCQTKGDKNITKRKAQQLFPDIKITHAIADALLIAKYCQETHIS